MDSPPVMRGSDMSEALYERYKDALRRGHVAALRGRNGAALEAYGEAAAIAPDRPLPLVGIGGILTRLGKGREALAAYDAALERSATDAGALRGRAETLVGLGERLAAAETFGRLAAVLDASGRLPDAADAARRALELAESRSRRAAMRDLLARFKDSGGPTAAEALALAAGVLDGRAKSAAWSGGQASGDDRHARGGDVAQAPVPEADDIESGPAVAPVTPFDPVRSRGEVEDAIEVGDAAAARTAALYACAGHRAAGQPNAAIDICYLALAAAPADPGIHLVLAELYLDQGWRTLAVDKLALLVRLVDLTADPEARASICALVSARLPDEPRLGDRCA
ncbi:MAG: hypothetical protein WEG56_03130 [Chloroflexota bacterium]